MRPSLKLNGMSAQLLVKEIERSLSFYIEQLGFRLDFRYEDMYAGLSNGVYSFHLKQADPDIEERVYRRMHEHVDFLFFVDDLKSVYRTIRAQGVDVIQLLRIMPYGKEFYISDPDGYIIAFMESS